MGFFVAHLANVRTTLTSSNDFKTRYFRNIVDAPRYIGNADLQMEMVMNEIGKSAKKHEEGLPHHDKVQAIQPLANSELVRRLKGGEGGLLSWSVV